MRVSCRLLIVPLGLLVIVSGCAGRLRQRFAPDREFMSLSELREYDEKEGSIHAERRGPAALLASLSPIHRSSENSDEEATSDGRRGFLRLGGLLSRNDDLPDDPFLAGNDRADAEEPDAEEQTAGPNPSVMTASSSRELPNDSSGSSERDSAESDSSLPRLSVPTLERRGTGMSFDHIMAEFRDDEFEEESSEVLSDSRDGDNEDFDDLFADSTEKDGPPESDDLDFHLFDDPKNAENDDADVPVIVMPDSSDHTPAEHFQESAASATAEQAADDHADVAALSGHLSDDLPDFGFDDSDAVESHGADSPESAPSSRQDSWTAGLEEHGNHPGAPEHDGAASFVDAPSLWSSDPSEHPAAFPDTHQRQHRVPVHTASSAADQTPVVLSNSPIVLPEHGSHTTEDDEHLTVPNPQADDEFVDDPFLSDFQEPAGTEAAAPAPAAPTAVPATTTLVLSIRPRTWILFLGGLIIAWLLFAPERQNRSIRSS